MSRLFGRILGDLIEKQKKLFEEEEQEGFRANRKQIMISVSNRIYKRNLPRTKKEPITFIVLQKSNDVVPLNKLWKILEAPQIGQIRKIATRVKFVNANCQIFTGTPNDSDRIVAYHHLDLNTAAVQHLNSVKKTKSGMEAEPNDTSLFTLQAAITGDKDDIKYMMKKLIEEYDRYLQ